MQRISSSITTKEIIDVSIVIVNYNTFDLTCQCINSIIEYTSDISYEIILVDNASKECNPDLFLDKFRQITVIKSEKNLGFAGGNNLGILASKGKYILLLNSDTWLIENSIKNCINKIKSDNKIGVLSCKLIGTDEKVQPNATYFYTWWRLILEVLRIKKIIPKKIRSYLFLGFDFDYNKSIYCDAVWGTFFLFKKSILNNFKDNLLPVNFFMYFEEIDWCMSFKKFGYKAYYYSDTYIYHIGGASGNNLNYNIIDSLIKLSIIHKNKLDEIVYKLVKIIKSGK